MEPLVLPGAPARPQADQELGHSVYWPSVISFLVGSAKLASTRLPSLRLLTVSVPFSTLTVAFSYQLGTIMVPAERLGWSPPPAWKKEWFPPTSWLACFTEGVKSPAGSWGREGLGALLHTGRH